MIFDKWDVDKSATLDLEEIKTGLKGLFYYADGLDMLASLIAIVALTGLGVTMVAFLFFIKPFFQDIGAMESSGGGLNMSTVNYMVRMIFILGASQFFISVPGFAVANISAARQKRTGLCSIAVTKGGRRLFASFGFETNHGWREKGGQRYLCHARLADLRLADLHRRLRVHDALITDVCVREGLTTSSKERLIGRC